MLHIVGGLCTITATIDDFPSRTSQFCIRGKNPLDMTARAYIDAHVDEEFRDYAWMIAKHESRDSPSGQIYNQFNPAGSKKCLPNKTNGTNTWGWGLCQIDRGRTPGCTTAEVYNWHTNVVAMNRTLRNKRSRFLEILQMYRETYLNDPTTRWFEPDNVVTNVSGMTISARQWSIMTLYNGAAGTHPLPFPGAERQHTPLHFDPVTTNWILYTNVNDYVPRVLSDRNVEVPNEL